MKLISKFLFFSILALIPSLVFAHEGHQAGPYHHHMAEVAAALFSVVLGVIMFIHYRQK